MTDKKNKKKVVMRVMCPYCENPLLIRYVDDRCYEVLTDRYIKQERDFARAINKIIEDTNKIIEDTNKIIKETKKQ